MDIHKRRRLAIWGITFFALAATLTLSAQENQTPATDLYFLSPELQAEAPWENGEIRVRTFQYTYNTQKNTWSSRNDLMFGWHLRQWRMFSYTQLSDNHQNWTGLRIDRNWALFHQQVQAHCQYRLFLGLNQQSAPYQFSYQSITYRYSPHWSWGAFGFAKDWLPAEKSGGDYWFVGPLGCTQIAPACSAMLGYGLDLTGHYQGLVFARLRATL